MLGFEVWVNKARRFCVAYPGAEEFGISLSHNPAVDSDLATLEASGYVERADQIPDELRWGQTAVRVGDEVLVRIVELETADAPSRTAYEQGLVSDPSRSMLCSNCGKSHHEIRSLVRAQRVTLCNECLDTLIEMRRDT